MRPAVTSPPSKLPTRLPPNTTRSKTPELQPPPQLVALLSGKGGVGKTNLAANLGIAAADQGARVLLVDGDLGLANLDVLLGLTPRRSVADLLSGACGIEEVLVEGPRGVHLLPAASGRPDLPALRPLALAALLAPLLSLAPQYDLVLLDAGAGIGPAVVGLAACCARALLVTTPEPTSFADAYATRKVLAREAPELVVELLVNGARDEQQARETHTHLDLVSRRFLGLELPLRGFLPTDRRLAEAVARQRAVVELSPEAVSSRRLRQLAQGLLHELRGPGESTKRGGA